MKRSLKRISALITLGTLLSKLGGMGRQIVIASVFGIGVAYDAYNYAYILPGFFLILIGGINGPIHNSIVTVLSKRDKKEGSYILNSINNSLILFLIIISAFLFFAADFIITILGPGLDNQTHSIATEQLKIMAPITLLSGLIGVGFGSLNARNKFFIPSISPIISSLILILSVAAFSLIETQDITSANLTLKGGKVLAQATLLGALMQWLIQLPLLRNEGLLRFKLFIDWTHAGVKEVWRIIIPATLSSGMLQINVFTDLFFASNIASAAAGLSYANFLVQTPVGLISNSLILPLLPVFSQLAKEKDREELLKRIRQGFIFSSGSMICLGAIFIALSEQITKLIFGRGVFDEEAINLVSGLLIYYGIGMPSYLIRDLLVRIFYTLGDAKKPFIISIIGISINILLDWLFIGGPSPWGSLSIINLGAQGLVLATVGVNIFSCIMLLFKLNIKVQGIKFKEWFSDLIKLLFCGFISGFITSKIGTLSLQIDGILSDIIHIISAISLGLFTFYILSNILGIKEINEITQSIIRKSNPGK